MQLYMKKTIKVDVPPVAAAGEAPAIIDVSGTVIKPKEEREKKVRAWAASFTFLLHQAKCWYHGGLRVGWGRGVADDT